MKAKKKILMIMSHLNGAGAEKACVDLLRNIDRNLYDITLLLIYRSGAFLDDVPSHIRVVSLYDGMPGRWKEKLLKRFPGVRNYGIRNRLLDKLSDEGFDVIISFSEGLPVVAHRSVAGKAPLNLSWVHCDMVKYPWTRRYYRNVDEERESYAGMDRIVAVSEEAREAFASKYGFKEKLEVIPNVIDRNQIIRKSDELKIDKKKFTIINVGRLVAVKNHRRLLEMMAILKGRGCDAELWILGEGPRLQKLVHQTEEMNLSDSVRFLGFRKNPYPYMKTADLYVMSSDAEGYSLTISESLCLGTPVVSTPTVRITELHATGAVEIADFDAESLADWTESFIRNPEKLAACSAKAFECGKIFDPTRVLTSVYRLLSNNKVIRNTVFDNES